MLWLIIPVLQILLPPRGCPESLQTSSGILMVSASLNRNSSQWADIGAETMVKEPYRKTCLILLVLMTSFQAVIEGFYHIKVKILCSISEWSSNAQACNRWTKFHQHYSVQWKHLARICVTNILYLILILLSLICLFSSSCYLICKKLGHTIFYTNYTNLLDDGICVRLVWQCKECIKDRHWYCTVYSATYKL